MTPSSVAGVITAVASVFSALALVIAAVGALLPLLRASRANTEGIREVHILVNQQRLDARRYTVELLDALRQAGVEIPHDQSLNDERPDDQAGR